jgi:hypothetical protein
MLSQLSTVTDAICAPLLLKERLLNELRLEDSESYCIVCYQYVEGAEPKITNPAEVSAMGERWPNYTSIWPA